MRKGFLIFTSNGDQNEFQVFCMQKSAFIDKKSDKKLPFSFQFMLCHVTYQKLRLEVRGPNFQFSWGSKLISCLSQAKKHFFRPKVGQKAVFFYSVYTCAAKAIFYCPSMNSHRPRSQNTAKEQALIPEKDSKRKRPRCHVSLEKSSKNHKPLEK